MCGNIGLLLSKDANVAIVEQELVQTNGYGVAVTVVAPAAVVEIVAESPLQLLPITTILHQMLAKTEVRGGQAGGVSAFENAFDGDKPAATGRVRAVAHKRFPLADTLSSALERKCPSGEGKHVRCISVIGYTRFATSSINTVPELHPHDWFNYSGTTKSRPTELVWKWDATELALAPSKATCQIHLSHNGDFDAIEMYGALVLNAKLGKWLEVVLDQPNASLGDSPKLAGLVELLCVQGRWGAATRLAWLRTLCTDLSDASLPVSLPPPPGRGATASHCIASTMERAFAPVFEREWREYAHHVVAPAASDARRYVISLEGQRELEQALVHALESPSVREALHEATGQWTVSQLRSFVHHAVRGFLRSDLYCAVTEAISRSEGSFGVQVHSSLEPGVVVLASKGQPMQLAFSPTQPLVLFGSEATATLVPVCADGSPLPCVLPLDELGEVVRVGLPSALLEGTYADTSGTGTSKGGRTASLTDKLIRRSTAAISAELAAIAAAQRVNGAEAEHHEELSIFGRLFSSSRSPLLSKEVGSRRGSKEGLGPRRGTKERRGSKEGLGPRRNTPSVDPNGQIELPGALTIRAYSLTRCVELSLAEITARVEWPHARAEQLADPPPPELDAPARSTRSTRQPSESLAAAAVPGGAASDLVALDLAQTPAVLRAVESSWCPPSETSPASPNWVSTDALAAHLLKLMLLRKRDDRGQIDLLIGGIETSMWLAEQFAADLNVFFPYLHVRCVSTNVLLGVGSFSPRKTFFSGVGTPSVESLRSAAILLVSHSGQTFPSLHATRLLDKLAPGRVWLLCGSPRTQMERSIASVRKARGQPEPTDRVILTCAGDRPAEAASLAVAAMHHTFTLMLMHLAEHVRQHAPAKQLEQPWERAAPPGAQPGAQSVLEAVSRTLQDTLQGVQLVDESEPLVRLTDGCLADMRTLAHATIEQCEAIVGVDTGGAPRASSTHTALVQQGHKWGQHVREPWVVLVLLGAYLVVSLVLACPVVWGVCHVCLQLAGLPDVELGWSLVRPLRGSPPGQDPAWMALGFGVRLLDAVVYIFCAKLLTWTLRATEGRALWGRHGKRTLVVIESPTNYKLLEAFVSKLFAQSYSFCSLEVHGAGGLDEFVHQFTHRVCRGLLMAVGRPDGRLCSLARTEASLLHACKLAFFVSNPSYPQGPHSGNAPEIFSLGHNSYEGRVEAAHVTLPSHSRKPFLDEVLYSTLVQRVTRSSTKATLRSVVRRTAAANLDRGSPAAFVRQNRSFRFSAGSRLGLSTTLQHYYGEHGHAVLGSHYLRESEVAVVEAGLERLLKKRTAHLAQPGGDEGGGGAEESHDPNVRLSLLDKFDAVTKEVLDRQLVVQRFYECRIAALERYLAFAAIVHAMADVASRPALAVQALGLSELAVQPAHRDDRLARERGRRLDQRRGRGHEQRSPGARAQVREPPARLQLCVLSPWWYPAHAHNRGALTPRAHTHRRSPSVTLMSTHFSQHTPRSCHVTLPPPGSACSAGCARARCARRTQCWLSLGHHVQAVELLGAPFVE